MTIRQANRLARELGSLSSRLRQNADQLHALADAARKYDLESLPGPVAELLDELERACTQLGAVVVTLRPDCRMDCTHAGEPDCQQAEGES